MPFVCGTVVGGGGCDRRARCDRAFFLCNHRSTFSRLAESSNEVNCKCRPLVLHSTVSDCEQQAGVEFAMISYFVHTVSFALSDRPALKQVFLVLLVELVTKEMRTLESSPCTLSKTF